MNEYVTSLVNGYGYILWFAVWLLSMRSLHLPGRVFFAAAFFLMAVQSMFTANPQLSGNHPEIVAQIAPWVQLVALGCFLLGVAAMSLAGGSDAGANPGDVVRRNQYLSTDELIARTATVETANDDLEFIKTQWYNALRAFEDDLPERTVLRGNEPFERTLWLERYADMRSFGGNDCGQLRTVMVRFSGPGDAMPWMTADIEYSIDQVPLARITLTNVKVLRTSDQPAKLREFRRIKKFLETGVIRVRLLEIIGAILGLFKLLIVVPVGIMLIWLALLYSPIRFLLKWFRVRTRFVPTRIPTALPPEPIGLPLGYWNTLLTGQADKQDEVVRQVLAGLEERAEFGFKTYQKDIVQWGGFAIKEVRQQTVLEFRRAKVKISVHRYGHDLYVRWDSHINNLCWFLYKFPYSLGVGFRFRRSWFSWAVPLFTEAPAIFEFAPAPWPATDFDWADVDVLQDLVHEILTGTVRRLKDRYHIEQEIDYEMRQGERTQQRPGQQPAPGKERAKRKWRLLPLGGK